MNGKTAAANQQLIRAWVDVSNGVLMWRLWSRLGWNDILQRYRRSVLGPFWLTASMAIFVISLGVVYATLFDNSIESFLPYFCAGLLIWNLISSYLTEGGMLFTGSEAYIKQIHLPYFLYALRASWAKLIIFFHNFVIYFAIIAYFRFWPGAAGLLAIPGLAIVVFNGTIASVTIGMVSARFRDIPQVIASIVQLIFFITPIAWKPESLKHYRFISDLNPFYHFVEIVRAPLLGTVPSLENYMVVLLFTAINAFVAGVFFVRFRKRLAYWV